MPVLATYQTAFRKARLSPATPPWPPGRPGNKPSILSHRPCGISCRCITNSPGKLVWSTGAVYHFSQLQSTRPNNPHLLLTTHSYTNGAVGKGLSNVDS